MKKKRIQAVFNFGSDRTTHKLFELDTLALLLREYFSEFWQDLNKKLNQNRFVDIGDQLEPLGQEAHSSIWKKVATTLFSRREMTSRGFDLEATAVFGINLHVIIRQRVGLLRILPDGGTWVLKRQPDGDVFMDEFPDEYLLLSPDGSSVFAHPKYGHIEWGLSGSVPNWEKCLLNPKQMIALGILEKHLGMSPGQNSQLIALRVAPDLVDFLSGEIIRLLRECCHVLARGRSDNRVEYNSAVEKLQELVTPARADNPPKPGSLGSLLTNVIKLKDSDEPNVRIYGRLAYEFACDMQKAVKLLTS